jgi:hypothetical protein
MIRRHLRRMLEKKPTTSLQKLVQRQKVRVAGKEEQQNSR